MIKKLLTLFLLSCATVAYAQQGSVQGTIKDAKTGETIPFAVVSVKQGGEVLYSGTADADGKYNINPVPVGKYDVEFQAMGYQTQSRTGVDVYANRPRVLNFDMTASTEVLQEVEIVWEKPLIQTGVTSEIITQEEIKNMPVRSLGAIASQTAGVLQSDDGQSLSFRGARSSGNVQFIDGVKVRGNVNLPRDAISQVEVITGGTPAQYGDVIGGVISTTTRGPSPRYFGSAEVLTSSVFDKYHFNLLNMTLGGPLLKRRNDRGEEKTIIGFLLSVDYQFENDPRPVFTPVHMATPEHQSRLESNPLRPGFGGLGTISSAEFTTMDDLTTQTFRPNNDRHELRVTGNLQFKTSKNTNFTVGGNLNYLNNRFDNGGGYRNWLFNSDNNALQTRTDWYAYARFQQSFEETAGSIFRNFFYTLQVDYTRNQGRTTDANHGDNVFRYGHVGRFAMTTIPFYAFGTDTATGLTGWRHTAFQNTGVEFTPSPHNPILARYTEQYLDFVDGGQISNQANSLNDIQQGGALLNGWAPNTVYNGLWTNVGAIQTGFSKFQNSQFRVSGNATFDIKDHSLRVGFEFEQRIDRGYSLGASGLWILMRNLQNQAILELDNSRPQPVYRDGVFQDTINYPRAFDPSVVRTFDRNVRRELGLDPNGTDFLDIDRYDPDFFRLDMFSANELLNIGGTQYVTYFGYDHTGDIARGNPSIAEFFGPNRTIPAFQPTYIAGFIQDQFTFKDLYFNVGVRIDYFDANQPVLRDQFSLYPVYTVGELGGTALADLRGGVPDGIGDDYYIYVDDKDNPSSIVGYRSGNQWYNADGSPQANPRVITNLSGGPNPFLKYPGTEGEQLDNTFEESFTDYTPQVTVSPRVSFQFPISEVAEFFAHYDILVQRPDPGLNRMNPIDFMQLENLSSGSFLSNPNLLPQKTTDYEIGFQQTLNERSALKISAFYREMRDMMQTIALIEAYPVTYFTYGNLDFSTVKGFTVGYDLRRTGNVRINANYTLQFADGSGSGPNSGANLARSGQPNLRYILPLDFDSRHQIFMNFDYRFKSGDGYNGPVWFNNQVFANAGAALLVNAISGTPYTRRNQAFNYTQGVGNVPLEGQINGSRLPWNIRFDLTLNKVWDVKVGKEGRRSGNLEVFVQIQNLFNKANILAVHPFTGDPEDDGFLTSPQGRANVQFQTNATSFAEMYNLAINNPFHFAQPRRMRLGIRVGF